MPRGRPRTTTPWENLLEEHPWKVFPKNTNSKTKLILGSFPPNKFTTHPEKQSPRDVDFFYGSEENDFWHLFINAKNLAYNWPHDHSGLKKWIEESEWLVSDIVQATKRKKDSAEDSDLLVEKWNVDTLNEILNRNAIKKIYFTSKYVEARFKAFVLPRLINDLEGVKLQTLISPSPNGLRRIEGFKLIFRSTPWEDLKTYRKRYYQHFLQ